MSTYAISLWTKQEWFLNRHFTDGKLEKNPGWEPSIALQHGVQVRCVILRRTRLWKVYVQTPNSDGHQHTSTLLFFWQTKTQVVIDDKDFLKWESFSPNKKQAQLASRVKIQATRQPGIRRFFLIEWRHRKQRKWTNLDLPSRRSSENHHLRKSAKHGKGHVNIVNPGGYNFYRFASNRPKFQL